MKSIAQISEGFFGFGHAVRECPFLVLMLVATWFVFPFAAASVVFPSDVIGFQDWMQGAPIRRFYTQQSLYSGIAMATMALALMGLIQLNLTTLIYRKVNEFALSGPSPSSLSRASPMGFGG